MNRIAPVYSRQGWSTAPSKRFINFSRLAVVALSAVTAGFFHMRFTSLYDYSYVVNLAARISSGQLPWVDFDSPVMPGSFYISWMFHEVFGWRSSANLLLTASVAAISAWLTFDLIQNFSTCFNFKTRRLHVIFLLWLIPVLGPHNAATFPFYDQFAVLFVLVTLRIGVASGSNPSGLTWFLFGLSAPLATFMKQNIGGAFLLGVCFLVIVFYSLGHVPRRPARFFFMGFLIFPSIFVVFLLITGSFGDFLQQSFFGAGQSKGVGTLSSLDSLFSLSVLAVFLATLLIIAVPDRVGWLKGEGTFAVTLVTLIFIAEIAKRTNVIPREQFFLLTFPYLPTIFLPVIAGVFIGMVTKRLGSKDFIPGLVLTGIFGAAAGSFLSQGPDGSSYSLGPIFLIGTMLAVSMMRQSQKRRSVSLALVIPVLFSSWFLPYSLQGERLAFVNLAHRETSLSDSFTGTIPVGDSQHASWFEIRRLFGDTESEVLILPMEDPLPYLFPRADYKGRCVQLNTTTCPSSTIEFERLTSEPPGLILIKENPQIAAEADGLSAELIEIFRRCASPDQKIGDYAIYVDASLNGCYPVISER